MLCQNTTTMMGSSMTNSNYDKLKTAALLILPAIGTLYFALAGIWGLHYAEQVLGTIVALETFLGAVVKALAMGYVAPDAGELFVKDGEVFASFSSDPVGMAKGDTVTMTVNK